MSTQRVAAGVPTGGQFAASAKDEAGIDLFDLRREAQAGALRARQEAERQEALAQRIEAYSVLADYPDDYTVDTTIWPEDVNEDGTFDVDLTYVYDEDGNEFEDLGGQGGAIPAGRIDGSHISTQFDDWRTEPDNLHSLISVAKAKAWFADYTAQHAVDANQDGAAVRHASNEIGLAFETLKARSVSGSNGTSRNVGDVLVGVSLYALRDSDGMPKPRGSAGDLTLTHRTGHQTFPFGQPGDPDNFETFEAAQAAAAARLAELNG